MAVLGYRVVVITILASVFLGCSGCSDKTSPSETSNASTVEAFSGYVADSFEALGSDTSAIKSKTHGYTVAGWKAVSIADVSAVGAGACAIPVSGLVTVPAELPYLMRELYNSAMGVGFLYGVEPAKDDFAIILGMWADEILIDEKTFHEIYATSAGIAARIQNEYGDDIIGMGGDFLEDRIKKFAEESAAKSHQSALPPSMQTHSIATGQLVSHAGTGVVLSNKMGAKVGTKMGSKVAVKVAAKMGAKYGVKGAASFIPFISAAACGGVNGVIMSGILDSANKYYRLTSYSRKLLEIEILSADSLAR